jgi:hypothetical protein
MQSQVHPNINTEEDKTELDFTLIFSSFLSVYF